MQQGQWLIKRGDTLGISALARIPPLRQNFKNDDFIMNTSVWQLPKPYRLNLLVKSLHILAMFMACIPASVMVCYISHGLLPRESKDAITSEAYKLATLGQVIMVNSP